MLRNSLACSSGLCQSFLSEASWAQKVPWHFPKGVPCEGYAPCNVCRLLAQGRTQSLRLLSWCASCQPQGEKSPPNPFCFSLEGEWVGSEGHKFLPMRVSRGGDACCPGVHLNIHPLLPSPLSGMVKSNDRSEEGALEVPTLSGSSCSWCFWVLLCSASLGKIPSLLKVRFSSPV